jgi:sugar (pentulose or hexulose) kinase
MTKRAIVVLDVGKTLSKASLWAPDGTLLAKRTRANQRVSAPAYLALDALGIETWLADTLTEFATLADVGHIVPVSHGAAAALVRGDELLLPPMDYEHPIPAPIQLAYSRLRDDFDQTGSPSLPDGLNLGAQLYWLQTLHPAAFSPGTRIMPWAQYWSWLLCGVAASEVTSLGCHTDLWRPTAHAFSQLSDDQGWTKLMAPMARAGQALGEISPAWHRRTRLARDTLIHCGIHDSNAALVAARGFPEIAHREATVLSTGTWFVSMRTPEPAADFAPLPSGRDCLLNVDADDHVVPSARFMGGREIELLTGIDTRRIDVKPDQPALLEALPSVARRKAMVLPTLAPGTGPYPTNRGQWLSMPDDEFQRRAGVCLYAALVADTCLDMIGTRRCVVVEGRFAESEAFVRSLAALRPDLQVFCANAQSDVSYGALRLLIPDLRPAGTLNPVRGCECELEDYRNAWLREAQRPVVSDSDQN